MWPLTLVLIQRIQWPQMTVLAMQITLAQVVAQSSDTNKVIAFDPGPRHLCGLWWRHGPGTLTQMPLAAGL